MGTSTAPRRKSAATLEREPEMNATDNRRQLYLLGSSVSSAMRCPSSKRSVCQSKRRVRAVSTTAQPIRRGHGAVPARRKTNAEASAKISPQVLHEPLAMQFTRGLDWPFRKLLD